MGRLFGPTGICISPICGSMVHFFGRLDFGFHISRLNESPESSDMLSNARMISSRILRVSGSINGLSKFQIRSLRANKDAVHGHTAKRHTQAVMPPRTNRQQPGNDPGWKIFGAAVAIAAGCLSVYVQSKPVVRDIQSYLPSFLERSVVSTIALDILLGYDEFTPRLVKQNEISSILERTEANGKYFVVYGAKGAGKSLLVDQSTKDHSGVIKLMLTSITKVTSSTPWRNIVGLLMSLLLRLLNL